MSGQNLYLPIADIAADAGLRVIVTATNAGWETRARSSGGFPALPLGVCWHHAASSPSTSDEACVNYQVRGNPDNPVGNVTLGRTGDVWPIAAGASNCAGKGGPMTFTRGDCPTDQGNTHLWNVEVNNSGVGEAWSVELVDAYITLSNALNAYCGNYPDDITSHALGAGDGYTDRKIDPATAAAVEGPWQPRSTNANGTWHLGDMRAECLARAGTRPPPPDPGDDMTDQQFAELMGVLNAIAAAQQADFDRDGTFGPKADEGISQRSAIYDALGSIGGKLDRITELLA